ncbi:MAG: hypothetical protein ACXVB0_06785 [Mucilaginibacter sp.]
MFVFKGAQEGFTVCLINLYFLLDQKVTKTQVSRNASLPHWAFSLQISQNHGLENSAPLSLARGCASAEFCNALPCAPRPASFWLISAEAVLLTGRRKLN